MSSDGSVSSRISQFGLYRSIDARTEEFLKLSKKRQIRQGCVCAAISTALTVTVVVTILLIYEYNVISEARRTNDKTNWLTLMNSSVDDSNLLQILNKEKINVDKSTLKLLPILLKAFNHNRYIDKIIEEPTSYYTPYEKDITTERVFTKNIFADTRNWMKTPYSRLYTIEYKTSPIVYMKNPTRNIEYFTKIRKIRDYQRMLNYVDRMISEKNYISVTQPMRRDYHYTEKPITINTSFRKQTLKQNMENIQNKTLKTMKGENKERKPINCKCFHKFGNVINKLLESIQQLMYYFTGSNLNKTLLYNNISTESEPQISMNDESTIINIKKTKTDNHHVLESTSKLVPTPPDKTFLKRHKYIVDFSPPKTLDLRKDYTVNAIMNFIKPSYMKNNKIGMNYGSNEVFSTTNGYSKSLNIKEISKESNSNPNRKHLDFINSNTQVDTFKSVADYILQKSIYDVSPDISSEISTLTTLPETDFSDNDDYTEITERTTSFNKFDMLYNNRFKVSKINITSQKKNISAEKTNLFKGLKINQFLYNISLMRKMGNLAPENKENALFFPHLHRFAPVSIQISKPNPAHTALWSNNMKKVTLNITESKNLTNQNSTKTKYTALSNRILIQNHTHNITSEPKPQTLLDKNITTETTIKQIEEAIIILRNATETNQIENYNEFSEDIYKEIVKLQDNSTLTKSMIPPGRSTYLEIQRNDWKHDENQDFDNEMNFIFD